MFKLLLFTTGLFFILAAYWQVHFMGVAIDVQRTPCELGSKSADLYRLPGLEKSEEKALRGTWKWVKTIEQYKNWMGDDPYFYSDLPRERIVENVIHFDENRVSYMDYPYKLNEQRRYEVLKDSVLFERGTKVSFYGFDDSNKSFCFKGDTLVLISAPYGYCYRTNYEFYVSIDDTLNYLKKIIESTVNWEEMSGKWRLSRYDKNRLDSEIPETLDLSNDNRQNYNWNYDTLIYQTEGEGKFIFESIKEFSDNVSLYLWFNSISGDKNVLQYYKLNETN